MPGLLGALISVVMAGIASPASYDKFSAALPETEKSMTEIFLAAPAQQAVNQLLALLTTLALATFGGLVTGQEMSVSQFSVYLFYSGLMMHTAGKLTSLTEEDMFNDNTNINDMADKCEVPEEVVSLLNEMKTHSNGVDEKSALLVAGGNGLH